MGGPWNPVALVADRLLSAVAALAMLAAALRLLGVGSVRRYWPLALYLGAAGGSTLARIRYPREDFSIWLAAEALQWICAAVFAAELARWLFDDYPAMSRFAAGLTRWAVAGCAAVALLNFWSDPPPPDGRSPLLHLAVAVDRAALAAVLTFLLAAGLLASWYPVRPRENAVRMLTGFLLLCAAAWAELLVANGAPQWTPWANAAHGLTALSVCVYWAAAVSREGECERVAPVAWNPDRAARLARQLADFEGSLAKISASWK